MFTTVFDDDVHIRGAGLHTHTQCLFLLLTLMLNSWTPQQAWAEVFPTFLLNWTMFIKCLNLTQTSLCLTSTKLFCLHICCPPFLTVLSENKIYTSCYFGAIVWGMPFPEMSASVRGAYNWWSHGSRMKGLGQPVWALRLEDFVRTITATGCFPLT